MSGKLAVNTTLGTASMLSTIASFLPFIGPQAKEIIGTVDNFVNQQEMISSARKLSEIASDAVQLADKIGAVGYVIVKEPSSQKKITTIKNSDIEEDPSANWNTIQGVFQNITATVDLKLYGDMFKTAASKMGHQDANNLIEQWLNDQIVDKEKEEFITDLSNLILIEHKRENYTVKNLSKGNKIITRDGLRQIVCVRFFSLELCYSAYKRSI